MTTVYTYISAWHFTHCLPQPGPVPPPPLQAESSTVRTTWPLRAQAATTAWRSVLRSGKTSLKVGRSVLSAFPLVAIYPRRALAVTFGKHLVSDKMRKQEAPLTSRIGVIGLQAE